MKKIWAPWRMEYIQDSAAKVASKSKKTGTCVLCQVIKGRPCPGNLVLHKGKTAFVVMNKYPYTNGHLMVLPYRHIGDYSKLKPEEHAELGELMSLSMQVLKKVFKAQGFNVGMNIGKAAGAGIVNHLHYHVVPRWEGDHNAMPVVAGLRVLIEHLKKTHERLLPVFKELSQ